MTLARFEREAGQWFGVDGLIEESEAGGGEETVALSVHFSHQHIVPSWKTEEKCVRICQIQVMFTHTRDAGWVKLVIISNNNNLKKLCSTFHAKR